MTLSPLAYRSWHALLTLFAIFLIAGCATNTPARGKNGTLNAENTVNQVNFSRQGRIAIRVDSEPAQSLSGAFTLNGNAQNGDLSLSTPLGSILAELSWTPQQAVLKANNETRRFDSTDTLMLQVTGTVLPLAALFDWLAGRDAPAAGWQVDLTQMNDPNRPDTQRLIAKRTDPLPTVELRVVLDK
ncbi:MAG: outer membrane lipoprotein LolB [Burkholderiaceae bacterium]